MENDAEKATTQRPSISWELVGIIAVLSVFLIMGLIWITAPSEGEGIGPPEQTTLTSDIILDAGIDENGRPYLGKQIATTAFYLFGDLTDPAIAEFNDGPFEKIKGDYLAPGLAKMIWVHHPTGVDSERAARAAICATDQFRFWDTYDWLIANQPPEDDELTESELQEIVERIGLDWMAIQTCMASPGTDELIQNDRDMADEMGVVTSPIFLIGDELIGMDIEQLRQALDAETEM
jgi:protein-disulfide isomerase